MRHHEKGGFVRVFKVTNIGHKELYQSYFLPHTIWTANFVEAQEYTVNRSEFHRDNWSAMQMEKNGRQSAGQQSWHNNICYFFIKDKIDQGEVSLLMYCQNGEMIADFFTKP
jgi:hypothetical protein